MKIDEVLEAGRKLTLSFTKDHILMSEFKKFIDETSYEWHDSLETQIEKKKKQIEFVEKQNSPDYEPMVAKLKEQLQIMEEKQKAAKGEE